MTKLKPAETAEIRDLGKNLWRARTRRGLTQQALARASGVSASDISKVEFQHRWPTLAQLVRLARALDVPLQWFLNGHNWPDTGLRDLALELQSLGIVDLFVPDAVVPGAFRPPEQTLALAVGGEPEPRVVEAVPAALAWNSWNPELLQAYGHAHDPRALHRLAWLADVALTLHRGKGFPGGARDAVHLAEFVRRIAPPREPDSLGYPEPKHHLPPVSKRWNVTYAADLTTFRARAERLHVLLSQRAAARPGRRRPP